MQKTKYNLENKIVDGRRLVDKIDKVHFREPVHLEFTMEDDDDFANRGYDSQVIVDLSKSNYFILDLRKFNNYKDYMLQTLDELLDLSPDGWPEEDITDLPSLPFGDISGTANIKFINYSDVQRFEILIIKPVWNVKINWTRFDQDVVFPFGDDKDDDFLQEEMAGQRIVTFRLGRSVNGMQQFIGIMTPWFSTKIYLDGQLNVNSSDPVDNYTGASCEIYYQNLLIDESDYQPGEEEEPLYLLNTNKISNGVVDGNNNVFFRLLRSYKPAVHITKEKSFTDGVPDDGEVGFLGNIIENSAQEDINTSITINKNGYYKYHLHTLQFGYPVWGTSPLYLDLEIEKQGVGTISNNFEISSSIDFNLRDLDYDLLKEKMIEVFFVDEPDNLLGGYVISEIFIFRRLYKEDNGTFIHQPSLGEWDSKNIVNGVALNYNVGDHVTYRKNEKERETHLFCKTSHTPFLMSPEVMEPFVGSDWETYWEIVGDDEESFDYSDLYYSDHITFMINPLFGETHSPIKVNNINIIASTGGIIGSQLLEVGDFSGQWLTDIIERKYNLRGKEY